ncbi:MAG: hypothetical protein KDA28_10750, partial [Phycisphaerales bacterium]|nr:hypothetical protein [Phycisphaerales bacterium]
LNIAKSVHWYVVKCLVRHTDGQRVPSSRGDAQQDNVNTVGSNVWIDWIELVETFLRHPKGGNPNRRIPPAPEQWWYPVFDQLAFQRFPGYNGNQRSRQPDLPHEMIFITRTQLDEQIRTASQMRSRAERDYNRGTSTR